MNLRRGLLVAVVSLLVLRAFVVAHPTRAVLPAANAAQPAEAQQDEAQPNQAPAPADAAPADAALDGAAPAGAERAAAEPAQPERYGVIIHMKGTITPQLEHFVYRALDKAEKLGAEVVVIEIDSPGGFLHSSLQMAQRFQETDWARVVAYVPREALSGAAIASLGCDVILVGPDARFGDAGPIFIGEDALFRHAPEKLRSDLAQQMRLLAEKSNRPPTLAEAMVDMKLQVFEVTNKKTGEKRFLSERELAAVDNPDDWEKGRPIVESGEGRFLEVVGRRAVELELAEGVAASRSDLIDELNLEQPVREIEPGFVDGLVYWLNRPLITGLLFVVGLVALYLEISAPGISIGGLTAGLCFALFFWSRFLGGTAGALELILFLSGIVFLACEVFVFPGFGICGLTGILLIASSLLLASQDFLIPRTQRELEQSAIGLAVVVGSGFLFLGAAMFLARHFGRLPVLNRLALDGPPAELPDDERYAKPTSPYLSQAYKVGIGDWGTAESPLRPAGKALFGDDYVDVVADGTFVDAGCPVKVVRISGNRIVVREVEAKGDSPV